MIQAITLGPITIHLYGLIIGLAVVAAWEWTTWILRQKKQDAHKYERTLWVLVLSGIIGARLYHVVDYWWYYSNHLGEIIAVWQGGLGIWGGVIGGSIGLWLSSKRRLMVADAVALSLPLGQAIGRWGNMVNEELFGRPTSLPWGWWVKGERLHPLFLYESLLNLGLFVGLNLWHKKHGGMGTGRFIGGYLIGYGIIRLCLESFRVISWQIAGMAAAQWVSLAAMAIGFLLIFWCRIKR